MTDMSCDDRTAIGYNLLIVHVYMCMEGVVETATMLPRHC